MALCDYGCGQEAKFQFKNGKFCCSSKWMKCFKYRVLFSKLSTGINNNMYGRKQTEVTKKKISESNKNPSEETRKKMSVSQRNRCDNYGLWKGGYNKKNIPSYNTYADKISFAERVRRNEYDLKILEVKCSYCGNWFVPTIINVQERIRSLNKCSGSEGRFYCSDKCKNECPIYKKIKYQHSFIKSSSREVQPELRQMRFEKDNYTCQICKKHQKELDVGLHCHHLEGIKWEPLESADIDKCITVCKNCHNEIHKKEGCRYTELICDKERGVS